MDRIDPYNNIPPSRDKPSGQSAQPMNMNAQYGPPPQAYGRTTGLSVRPQNTPGSGGPVDLGTENFMLRSDLQTAITYIHQLGGRWPPPGQ